MPRSGFAGAVTFTPLACSRSMTPFQLEPSANAPCTSTTVGELDGSDLTWVLLGLGVDGLRRRPLRVRSRLGGREELDEQLVDLLGLVVVDPVRGVGQALDAVEVGHVVVVGLGEVGAEVASRARPR